MIALIAFVLICFLSIILFFWAQRKMNKAMTALMAINENIGGEMACKCKEVKIKDPNQPSAEPIEESFRIALIRESKKFIQANSEKHDLEMRMKIQLQAHEEMIRKMNHHVRALERYAKEAYDHIPERNKEEFQKKNGKPPITLRVAKNG
jgi:hypothetical protein